MSSVLPSESRRSHAQAKYAGVLKSYNALIALVKRVLVQTRKKALNASMRCKLLLCTPVYSTWACHRLNSVGKITLVCGAWITHSFLTWYYTMLMFHCISNFMKNIFLYNKKQVYFIFMDFVLPRNLSKETHGALSSIGESMVHRPSAVMPLASLLLSIHWPRIWMQSALQKKNEIYITT